MIPRPLVLARRGLALPALMLAAAITACGDNGTGLPVGAHMELTLTAGTDTAQDAPLPLGHVDPKRDGTLALWVAGADGQWIPAGPVTGTPAAEGGRATISFDLPVADPRRIELTLQPPGDTSAAPSPYVLLAGSFRQGVAQLSIDGVVTDGRDLEHHPGAHSLFTSSNNVREGYPSEENAGLWYFTLTPWANVHKSRYVKLTPLQSAWIYEGWIVYRPGTPQECWVSHGKFRPDLLGLLTSRDNTGSGPFSGDEDYVNGGIEDVPGDEWTTNIFNLPTPCGLPLPLQLDAVDSTGHAIWYHAITIEPAFQESEALETEKPFILRPYRNPVGAGGPGDPRVILFRDNVLRGTARLAH